MCLDDLVIIAKVSHPIPFRTRPLNPLALMVLRLKARESKSSPDLPNISVSLVYVCYMCCTHCSAMGVPFYYMLYSPHTQFTWDICCPFRTQHYSALRTLVLHLALPVSSIIIGKSFHSVLMLFILPKLEFLLNPLIYLA